MKDMVAFDPNDSKLKCSIQGCPGEYRSQLILHTIKHGEDVFVFENVPADVCDVCADVLLAPSTVRHLEQILHQKIEPEKFAPIYEYV
jgi:YgiT-type zinc finger domain-containing protein